MDVLQEKESQWLTATMLILHEDSARLGINQGWQGNITEAGGREIVRILHVSSDNAELEYER